MGGVKLAGPPYFFLAEGMEVRWLFSLIFHIIPLEGNVRIQDFQIVGGADPLAAAVRADFSAIFPASFCGSDLFLDYVGPGMPFSAAPVDRCMAFGGVERGRLCVAGFVPIPEKLGKGFCQVIKAAGLSVAAVGAVIFSPGRVRWLGVVCHCRLHTGHCSVMSFPAELPS